MELPLPNPNRLPRRTAALHRTLVLAAAAGATLSACGTAPAAPLGSSPAEARANTHDLFGAFALRMGPLTRSPELARIRPQYVRGSLVPSRIYDRGDMWTSRNGNVRTLTVAGSPRPDGGYALDVRRDAPPPVRTGDSRHVMELRRLGDEGVYEWRSVDELAVGGAEEALPKGGRDASCAPRGTSRCPARPRRSPGSTPWTRSSRRPSPMAARASRS